MGVVARAVAHYADDIGESLGADLQAEENLTKVNESGVGLQEYERASAVVDDAVFGVSVNEIDKPLVLPEVKAKFQSRENPAILKTVGKTEDLSKEELEEQDILGKSKRNRLRVPLTGGVSTTSAGVAAPAAPGTGTGLKI